MEKYGLELLFGSVNHELNQPSDVVFVLLHWIVTSDKGFKCVGIGENFGETDAKPTEFLPSKWNENNEKEGEGHFYMTKYRQSPSNEKYVLKMVFSAGTMWQILLCRTGDDKIVSMSIEIDKEVSDLSKGVSAFKDVDKLIGCMKKDLLEKMFPPQVNQTQKEEMQSRVDSASHPPSRPAKPYPVGPSPRSGPRPLPDFPNPYPDAYYPQGAGPFGGEPQRPIFDQPGGADLDPFGQRGGGGMLTGPPKGIMRGPKYDDPFGQNGGTGGFSGRFGGGGGSFGNFM